MDYIEKVVADDWVKMSTYIYTSASWTINCEYNRQCEVGTGVFFRGKPRGSKTKFTTHAEFNTIGAGKVMVRVIDGKGPCTVRLSEGSVGLIPIYPVPKVPSFNKDK